MANDAKGSIAKEAKVKEASKKAKSEAMVKKAAKADKTRIKKEALMRDKGLDPFADIEKPIAPMALKKIKNGFECEFKANHGRVKFGGVLYERGKTFTTQMTDELRALCEIGVLIPKEK